MAQRPMFQLLGGRELRKQLRKAGDDLADLRDANSQVGRIVAGAAIGMAPVVTGRLASTIRAGNRTTGAVVSAGRASVPYAGPIHWGWPARNIEPHTFLVDAGKQTEPVWTAVYINALDRILDQVKGGNGA